MLDPFIGSGTTAVACIKTNRKYIGFEINPDYYEVAQERIRIHMQQQTIFELLKGGYTMNRFKCPACGRDQYTACSTSEKCIYCGYKGQLMKMETLEPEESEVEK